MSLVADLVLSGPFDPDHDRFRRGPSGLIYSLGIVYCVQREGSRWKTPMNEAQAIDIAREAISTLLIVSMPLMLVGLAVGLAIAVFQALTQIQEVTLTFVPKILIVFVSMIVFLPFMLRQMQDLAFYLMDLIVAVR